MQGVNTVFRKYNFWRHHELVRSGWVSILLVIGGSVRVESDRVRYLAGRVTENGPVDISVFDSRSSLELPTNRRSIKE